MSVFYSFITFRTKRNLCIHVLKTHTERIKGLVRTETLEEVL